MSGIFLSWGSPDRDRVLPFRDRLREVGLRVWEYSEDMPAGAHIHDDILKTINNVQMAIICFSDATAERDWIHTEAAWCYQTYKEGNRPLKNILPVWIGPHPADKLPPPLVGTDLRAFDLASGGNDAVGKLLFDVFKQLGREAPRVVPAALLAMTRQQCAALFAGQPSNEILSQLCLAVGMEAQNLAGVLEPRYGPTPWDLSPFAPDERLIDYVNATLTKANERRIASGQRPVWLRWMHDELFGPGSSQPMRNLWAAGDSLLIVDSVSTFHPEVTAQLAKLPQPKFRTRSAVLWVPPYTRHTARLENALRATAATVGDMGDAFDDWENEPQRPIAFDTGTSVAMRLWLYRAFLGIADGVEPIFDQAAAFRNGVGSQAVSLAQMIAGTTK
jgi:hypothetical protein